MDLPPAVDFPVVRPAAVFRCWTGLLALAAVAALVYLARMRTGNVAHGWQAALLAAAWLCATVAMAAEWRRSPVGTLRWTGATWRWQGGALSGQRASMRRRVARADGPPPAPVSLAPPHGDESVEGGEIVEVRLSLQADLQHLLLVRVLPLAGRAAWLWLAQREAPPRWQALRCAVFAHGPASASEASYPTNRPEHTA